MKFRLIILPTLFSHVYSAASERAHCEIRAQSSESLSTAPRTSINSSASSGDVTTEFSPGVSISRTDGTPVATMGFQAAMYSKSLSGEVNSPASVPSLMVALDK